MFELLLDRFKFKIVIINFFDGMLQAGRTGAFSRSKIDQCNIIIEYSIKILSPFPLNYLIDFNKC